MTDYCSREQQAHEHNELEHRLWDALDHVSTGTWTQDDIAIINWQTGLRNWTPPKREKEEK